jgi:hypothetical protein
MQRIIPAGDDADEKWLDAVGEMSTEVAKHGGAEVKEEEGMGEEFNKYLMEARAAPAAAAPTARTAGACVRGRCQARTCCGRWWS